MQTKNILVNSEVEVHPEETGLQKKEECSPKFKGEKRLFERIQYQRRLATVSIGEDCFSVRDLSVISLRFANTYNVAVPQTAFHATVHLLCGEDVAITGVIYRKLQHDMVIMMKKGIPVELLERERSYVKKMAARVNK